MRKVLLFPGTPATGLRATESTRTRAAQAGKQSSSAVRCKKSVQLLLLIAGQLLFDLANEVILFCRDLGFRCVKSDCGIADIHRNW